MRRLEAERQRLEAELRRAKEQMRRGERGEREAARNRERGQRDAARNQQRRGPGQPNAVPAPPTPYAAPMPMPTPAPTPGIPFLPGPPGGPAPMNANPFGQPNPQPQPRQHGSDWERELMRAHGFDAGPRGQGRADAAFLGVNVSPVPESLRGRLQLPAGIGMVVASVEPRSPAQQAGIQPRDVLHKIDDQLLVNAEQLAALVRTFKAGREVRVSLVRGGKPMQVKVKLGQRNLPPLPDRNFGRGPQSQLTPAMPGMRGMPGMPGMPGMHMPGMPPGAGPQYAPAPVQPARPPATPAAPGNVAPVRV